VRGSPDEARTASTRRRAETLHLFALSALATQPLFDLLARYSPLFVAHGAHGADLILLTAVIALVIPATIAVLESVVGWAGERTRTAVHVSAVGFLVAVIVLPLTHRRWGLPDGPAMAVAGLAGIAAAVGYARLGVVRLFATGLAPCVIVFPALFLASGTIRTLIFPGSPPAAAALHVGSPAPVVFVVFDEFSTTALLDERHEIDDVRYPHFAALARESTWYRNATTVADFTTIAVPAILTGRYPDRNTLPVAGEYPQNLFTLLGGTYRLRVLEAGTDLCAFPECGGTQGQAKGSRAPARDRIPALLQDVGLLYLHVLLPPSLRTRLPSLTDLWNIRTRPQKKVLMGAGKLARESAFEGFLLSLEPTPWPTLFFLHVMLPHQPYRYLPSGQSYSAPSNMPGKTVQWLWEDDPVAVGEAWRRYLLQVGFVDGLLGRLLERLRAQDLYDRSLLVITADHGVCFRPREGQRFLTPTNYDCLMPVPLFVKLPRQAAGHVDDRNVQTIDILPTIADALGIEMPWSVDGRSLLDSNSGGPAEKVIFGWHPTPLLSDLGKMVLPAALPAGDRDLREKLKLFGARTPSDDLLATGPFPDLIGIDIGAQGPLDVSPVSVTIANPAAFENVQPDGPSVPVRITGTLRGAAGAADVTAIAVAVNGMVRGAAKPYLARRSFSVMVPVSSFRRGPNQVRALIVHVNGSRVELRSPRDG